MRQNIFLIIGLILLLLVGSLVSLPTIRDQIGQLIQNNIFGTQVTGPQLPIRTSDKQVCGLCHSEKSRDFAKKYQHAPFAKWYCTDCHVPHNVGTAKHEYVVNLDQLCFTCHFNRMDTKEYKYQHKPYEMGHCVDCHNPHASDYPKLVRTQPDELCRACHKQTGLFELPYKHKPYEKGYCVDCHLPHASKYPALTKLKGKQLCFSCHYDRANEQMLPVQHKPYEQGECTNCHSPHTASAPKLLYAPGNLLCLTCHVGMNEKLKSGNTVHPPVQRNCTNCHTPHASSKPDLLPLSSTQLCFKCHVSKVKEFAKPSHHPVGNGLVDCEGCHDPHVGQGKSLEKKLGNDLCYTCHLGLKQTFDPQAHGTKAKGKDGVGACTNCHLPHGSVNKPLLMTPEKLLCEDCHASIAKSPMNHPVGDQYKNPWHGGTMQCSSCHGPHGTKYRNFLLLTKDGLCLKCHGSKLPNTNDWDIHSTIPPRNEARPDGFTTEVFTQLNEQRSKTFNIKPKGTK